MNPRILGVMLATIGWLTAAGCANGAARAQQLTSSKAEQPNLEAIPVGPESHVCVSVIVDKNIWARPQWMEVDRAFSGVLTSPLRQILEERDPNVDNMPGTHNEQRFRADAYGRDPACQHPGTDVFVHVRYGPRESGKPFLMRYWVSRGAAVRYGSFDVDVAQEIAAGRIRGYSRDRNIGTVIGEDALRRAEMISQLLVMSQR